MTPEPRQWYKNSERLPTEEQLKKGVLLWWTDRLAPVLKFELKHNEQDFWWMPADIPPLPKPKEESQAEKDWTTWYNMEWPGTYSEAVPQYAALIRADQEAKTKAELGKKVDERIAKNEMFNLYPDLLAIFAPTTPTKGTP